MTHLLRVWLVFLILLLSLSFSVLPSMADHTAQAQPSATLLQTLTADDFAVGEAEQFDAFGWTVDIEDNLIIIGGVEDVYIAQTDDFQTWALAHKLPLAPPVTTLAYGVSTALNEGQAIVGFSNSVTTFDYSGNQWRVNQLLEIPISFPRDAIVNFLSVDGDHMLTMTGGMVAHSPMQHFVRNGTTWSRHSELMPTRNVVLTQPTIDGSRALITARCREEGGLESCAVHAVDEYELVNGNWLYRATINAPGEDYWYFGERQTFQGDTAVIGRDLESASVYVRDANGVWNLAQTLERVEEPTYVNFPQSMILQGNLLLLSNARENQDNQIYFYRRVDETWELRSIFTVPDTDGMNIELALQGDILVLGYSDHDTPQIEGAGRVDIYRLNDVVFGFERERVSEEALYTHLQNAIQAHSEGEIAFILVDVINDAMNLTVRLKDGTVGTVQVFSDHSENLPNLQYRNVQTSGDVNRFTGIIHAELPTLMTDMLDVVIRSYEGTGALSGFLFDTQGFSLKYNLD